eukprot:2582123-Pyramimonas_sp.AAC.1
MPVLVFIEPVDSRAARAAECPWPPGQIVDSAGGAGDDGGVSADGEDCPRLDGECDGEGGGSPRRPRSRHR